MKNDGKHLKRLKKVSTLVQTARLSTLIITVAVSLVIIVIIAIALVRRPSSIQGFFSGDHKDQSIQIVELYNVKTEENVEGAKKQLSFEEGTPILAKLILKTSSAPSSVTGKIYNINDKQTILKQVNFDVQKPEEGDPKATFTSYLPVLTSSRSTLPSGNYELILESPDGKELAKETFSIYAKTAQ